MRDESERGITLENKHLLHISNTQQLDELRKEISLFVKSITLSTRTFSERTTLEITNLLS